MSELLRKGRLSHVRKDVARFTSSAKDDERLVRHIVKINKAHVIMLAENGIIDTEDCKKIIEALNKIDGKLELSPEKEDAHMAVEEEVIKAAGSTVGGNLNLAKSRNDQVATAIRMNLREELLKLVETILELQDALIQKSERNLETVIPGYTHLQPAQPVTFAHYLVSQFDALQRNIERFEENYRRVDLCPMGACALATTSFPIDRERVAELLGFSGILENSLDAVSTRDFLLETLANLALLAVDVTRFVEDLIVWSTSEFGIVELPDEFAFTSSIMPQKKNPDVLEVIRARMGILIGSFVSCATVLKGLPSAYNMDFQEVTPRLWEALQTAQSCLSMLSKVTLSLEVKPNVLEKPSLTFLAATELANMLVRNHKVPFRTAHKIVGALIKTLIDEHKSLNDVTPTLLAEISDKFLETPLDVNVEEISISVDPYLVVKSHKTKGGPAEQETRRMINARKNVLTASEKWIWEKKNILEKTDRSLDAEADKILGKG